MSIASAAFVWFREARGQPGEAAVRARRAVDRTAIARDGEA